MYLVIGHRNPDTDSFCASVVFAQYLRDTWRDATAYALWKPNKETEFVFHHRNVWIPEEKIIFPKWSMLVLVDHNEAPQSVPNRDEYMIAMVIDHHKISDFNTSTPPQYMRVQAVWSTCTILHQMFLAKNYTPSREMAWLMISAIVSDTLLLRSPTTTVYDKEAVSHLMLIAWIQDLEQYAMDMFTAKSNLWAMPAQEIIWLDYKHYTIAGKKIWIGTMETTNPSYALQRKDELIAAIRYRKSDEQIDHLLFCVVDILHETNLAIVADDQDATLIAGAYGVTTDPLTSLANLWDLISRKLQLVPMLEKYLKS
jgi:manganese-dependent inorganic pyrophosphatase